MKYYAVKKDTQLAFSIAGLLAKKLLKVFLAQYFNLSLLEKKPKLSYKIRIYGKNG